MSNKSTQGLRFAAFVRVSTKRQEKEGNSLNTQRDSIERDVARLGGTVVEWYGGQEHATPGWEKKHKDRLFKDAASKKFNALIAADQDRLWRDADQANEDIKLLRQHKIQLYFGTHAQDLHNLEQSLLRKIKGHFDEYIAQKQTKRSIDSRINRAKQGEPTTGKLPYGRIYDKAKKEWELIPEKVAAIANIIDRYLKGEQLPKLAKEYHMNHSGLCRILKEQLGPHWLMIFDVPRFDIFETVPFIIPELVPPEIVRLVKLKLQANRTHHHKSPEKNRVHEYLLSGFIFCEACGYSMIGEAVKKTHYGKPYFHRYYRHPHTDRTRPCPLKPRPWVRADPIETAVVEELMELFSNPSLIPRAVALAVPQAGDEHARLQKLEADLARKHSGRQQLAELVGEGVMPKEDAVKKLKELNEQEVVLREQIEGMRATIGTAPSPQEVEVMTQVMRNLIEEAAQKEGGLKAILERTCSAEDKRLLVEAVFNAPLSDGTPAGVYIRPEGEYKPHCPRSWNYRLRGKLEINAVGGFGESRIGPSISTPLPEPRNSTLPFLLTGTTKHAV